MSLVVFENVSLSFGNRTILDELNLRIGDSDRIGLIGPNGSGKTSLLRLLSAEQAPDGGSVRTSGGVRIGYLPQDIQLEPGHRLLSFVRESVPGRAELNDQVGECERRLAEIEARGGDDPESTEEMMSCAERLSELHERVTHYDIHFTEHEATRILAGLGFSTADHDRPLDELSGGWKMRAVLAGLLFQQPELLLLDEPTNHLDLPSVTWFADFLQQYKRSFILICHDREFLNSQIRKIVSFELEGVRQYPGDYEKYLKQRAEEEIILENKAKNLEREREQAERFINRFRAQANKAKAVQSRVKALAKMESVETYAKRATMRFKFPPTGRSANEPIKIDKLSKSYDGLKVLSDVDLTVRRGDRIGIIGVNGAGKTTLLRMMGGEIEPSGGAIEIGHNVKVGYYAQHHADTLHKQSTIFEEVSHEDPDASITRVRSILGSFLFSGDDVDKKIGVLSGGERARVALAKLLVNPGNLLMMDEPTNHLDLASSESLAESLTSYDGTLIFVSHNLGFVRRLANKIWNVEGGTVETYPGTMDEYMDAWRARQGDGGDGGDTGDGKPTPSGSADASPAGASGDDAPVAKRKRGSRAEEKERKRREAEARKGVSNAGKLGKKVAELEAKIAELEQAQKERSALLADPEYYGDGARSAETMREFGDAKAELEALAEQWMAAQDAVESAK